MFPHKPYRSQGLKNTQKDANWPTWASRPPHPPKKSTGQPSVVSWYSLNINCGYNISKQMPGLNQTTSLSFYSLSPRGWKRSCKHISTIYNQHGGPHRSWTHFPPPGHKRLPCGWHLHHMLILVYVSMFTHPVSSPDLRDFSWKFILLHRRGKQALSTRWIWQLQL